MTTIVGVDIASESFAACRFSHEHSERLSFDNTTSGFKACQHWLSSSGVVPASTLVVVEATGIYWEALALHFHQQGFVVSVVNPAQVKYFARAVLQRGKSDELDAELLARFGLQMHPRAWQPPSVISEELQALMRQRDAYIGMLTQERNRLHVYQRAAHPPKKSLAVCQRTIAFLRRQVKELDKSFKDILRGDPQWQRLFELLQTIPGIGMITAGVLLTETQALQAFHSARQLTAYAGIAPAPYQSGSSVHRQPRISKIGNPRLRHAFYMAALSSIRFNPLIRTFYGRLVARGKPKKLVVVAVARKLLCWTFAICKSQQPFSPDYTLT